MSEDKGKLSDKNSQDNLMPSFGGIVYGLTPITGASAAFLGGVVAHAGRVENSETENNSKYSAELEEIFTQLHEADYCIAETRQNTVQLGIETRSILDDLRKQLG